MVIKHYNASGSDTIKIAVIQMAPVVGDKSKNISKTIDLLDKAASQGAGLAVLPELCNTGYAFNSRRELLALSEKVPEGDTSAALIDNAKKNNIYIVAGIAELDDNIVYNSAIVVGPEGYIGIYRKNHLWYKEKLLFETGNMGFPVYDLPFGKLGIQICYDFCFVEGVRILALQGADIVAVPTNWPAGDPKSTWDAQGYCMGNYRSIVHSNANKVYIACANRVGEERGHRFSGCSIITGPAGWPIAGPASKDSEEILYADVNILEGRRMRMLNLDESLQDRRTDFYDLMLGYQKPKMPL